MSENETFIDEEEEIIDEYDERSASIAFFMIMNYIHICYFILLILIGIPSNILAILILIRRRLWRNNETYIYLAAILIINTVRSILLYGNAWLHQLDRYLLTLSISSDIACKLWVWAHHALRCSKWLYVLMLLSVTLRQQLMTSNDSSRRGYASLAAKYCTLFGAKVAVSSFFTVAAVVTFWSFSISDLQQRRDTWLCTSLDNYRKHYGLLFEASWWVVNNIPLIVMIALLLLIFWKRKRSARFVFTHMEGASQDNGDVEEATKICVGSAVALTVICAPHHLIYELRWYLPHGLKMYIFEHVMILLSLAEPLLTPIICFAVKSRFRDELRAIVSLLRCCNGAKWHNTLPPEPDINGSSVLQMVPIEEDSPITGRSEI